MRNTLWGLRAATLWATAAFVITGVAGAQETAQAPGADAGAAAGEDIVVIGYRAQNRAAIMAKRDTLQIAEFLAVDEIGQLPDYNISDSFRRVPGVQTIFDEDEGRYVAVRGLNPNFTLGTFDGAGIATAERQNRQLNMEAIPTTAVKRLEVFKSRTPDLDGNAIGGSVNLVSRSAFDEDGLFYTAQAFVGYGDSRDIPGEGFNRENDDALNVRFDGTVSYAFGPRDQFGILLTGAYSQKNRDQERQLPQAYSLSNGVPVGTFRTSSYPNTVDRYGGTVKLEWRPLETLKTDLSFTHYVQDDNELRFNQDLSVSGFSAGGAPNTLNVATAGANVVFNDFPIEKPLSIGQAGFDWAATSDHRFSGRVSYSEAEFNEASQQVTFATPSSTTNAGVYRLTDGVPGFTFSTPATATALNPANFTFSSYAPYEDDSDDYIREAQLDYGYNTEGADAGWGFGFGVKWRENERDFDTGTGTINAAPGAAIPNLSQFLASQSYRSPYAVSNQFILDFERFNQFFRANRGLFTSGARSAVQERGRDYIVTETINAAYALGRYRGEFYTLVFGGRFEETETEIDGFRIAGTNVTPLSREGEYDHFLPSVNFILDLTDDLKLRTAFYQAIGRPSPNDLGTNENLVVTSAQLATGTLSRGNPNLQPREADNIDLALEYYLAGGQGLLSVGVFFKDIENDIFNAAAGTVVIDGTTFNVTQPQNLSTSRIRGLELQLIKNNLDFLPGRLSNFGVSGNLTILDVEADFPGGFKFDRLTGQAGTLGNFALFYEEGPFQARATYAYTGNYYTEINPTNFGNSRFDRAYNQVDLQGRYSIGDFELIGEVRNLTDENRVNYQTTFAGNAARDLNFFGRQFWLGVAFKP